MVVYDKTLIDEEESKHDYKDDSSVRREMGGVFIKEEDIEKEMNKGEMKEEAKASEMKNEMYVEGINIINEFIVDLMYCQNQEIKRIAEFNDMVNELRIKVEHEIDKFNCFREQIKK